jgi:hypothetical protein
MSGSRRYRADRFRVAHRPARSQSALRRGYDPENNHHDPRWTDVLALDGALFDGAEGIEYRIHPASLTVLGPTEPA